MPVLAPELALKAAAAIVLAVLGVGVAASGGRRAADAFLGAFIALLAANQAAEALRATAAGADAALLWHRAATVFAAVDPLFLFYFASLYPERNHLQRARFLVPVAVGAALFAGLSPLVEASTEHDLTAVVKVGLSLYTTVVYGVVLRHLLRSQAGASGARLLAMGLVLAWMPTVVRAVDDAHTALVSLREAWIPPLALAGGVLLAPLALAAALVARWSGGWRRARGWILAAAALAVVMFLLPLQGALSQALLGRAVPLPAALVEALRILGSASTSIRWVAFCALASVGLFRHNLLGLALAARRRLARAVVAAGVLGVGLVTLALLPPVGGPEPRMGAFEWSVLAILVASSQLSRRLVDKVAAALYGVPVAGDAARSAEAYRAAVLGSLEGAAGQDAALARLRRELGIEEPLALAIEQDALRSQASGIFPGKAVGGRYRILRPLGEGSGGRAFLATDEILSREVVLKAIPAVHAGQAIREARIAGSIHHPNVVTLHDVLAVGDATVLVMEYVPGGSLEDRMREDGGWTPERAEELLDGILAGVAAVHERGVVHRDLKPANILLADARRPKIADFGIARLVGGRTLGPGEVPGPRGSPGFMAPEVMRGEPGTPASDVFSLGRIGRLLLREGADPAVDAVIQRALAESPAERWPDAGEMARALRQARGLTT